jgi:hypothetical protein
MGISTVLAMNWKVFVKMVHQILWILELGFTLNTIKFTRWMNYLLVAGVAKY